MFILENWKIPKGIKENNHPESYHKKRTETLAHFFNFYVILSCFMYFEQS